MVIYILLSLEQNEWSARTNENNCRNKFICHPEQQMWCPNKSEQGSTHVITIAKTTYYYNPNKFVCHLEKKVSEQMRKTVRTESYYSRNNFVCHLEQKRM
jgi:hypothetical protein